MLGGTSFVGRYLVEAALAEGHTVTLFTRGRTNLDLFPQCERLVGDRIGNISALEGRRWDAVADTTGFHPDVVARSNGVLAGRIGFYLFVSTISVYADYGRQGVDEDSPVARLDNDALIARRDTGAYGPLKARCEEVAEEAFPGRTLIVRCGLIVGPHDNVKRFTYWPRRVAIGGEVLAPGKRRRMIQVIDVRDLADWMSSMISRQRPGIFNATGARSTMGELLEQSKAISRSDASFTWCSDDFLVENRVKPQTELPLWSPLRPGQDGHYGIANERAIAEGMTFRGLATTVRDTLAWVGDAPAHTVGQGGPVGLSPEREAELLDAWQRRS
jgi:2'-hydroxyisoflavone reductase